MKESELNRLVDAVFHPFFKKHKAVIIADGIAHAIVEKNPKKSAVKFLRYSLKELLR